MFAQLDLLYSFVLFSPNNRIIISFRSVLFLLDFCFFINIVIQFEILLKTKSAFSVKQEFFIAISLTVPN